MMVGRRDLLSRRCVLPRFYVHWQGLSISSRADREAWGHKCSSTWSCREWGCTFERHKAEEHRGLLRHPARAGVREAHGLCPCAANAAQVSPCTQRTIMAEASSGQHPISCWPQTLTQRLGDLELLQSSHQVVAEGAEVPELEPLLFDEPVLGKGGGNGHHPVEAERAAAGRERPYTGWIGTLRFSCANGTARRHSRSKQSAEGPHAKCFERRSLVPLRAGVLVCSSASSPPLRTHLACTRNIR